MPKNVASKTIKVSKKLDATQRREIGADVIEYIQKRSKQGKGKSNRPWKGDAGVYSEAYKNSKKFKQKGKSSLVNLTLDNEMLQALSVIANRPGEVTIGYKLGSSQWGKAKGNIIGSYGKPRANPKKARNFLAITQSEINKAIFSESSDDESN